MNLRAAVQRTTDKAELRSLGKAILAHEKALKVAGKAQAKAEAKRASHALRNYAESGFVDLRKDLVESMKVAGFRWGGDWKVHKDVAHFDI